VFIWPLQTIFTLKDGAKIEEFKSVIDPFRVGFASKVPTSRAVNSFNDREVFLFSGWNSIEVGFVSAQRLPQYQWI
jgi:hypothetical protein